MVQDGIIWSAFRVVHVVEGVVVKGMDEAHEGGFIDGKICFAVDDVEYELDEQDVFVLCVGLYMNAEFQVGFQLDVCLWIEGAEDAVCVFQAELQVFQAVECTYHCAHERLN